MSTATIVRPLPTPVDANWRVYGNCGNLRDPDVMTPRLRDHEGIAEAKQICAACPVKAECLDDAIRRDERYGVWGGHTPAERKASNALARRVAAATRKCRFCGIRRPAGDVVDRRCSACTRTAPKPVRPPLRLLQAGDTIAALKQQKTPDQVIGKQMGCTAAEVTAARRALGIDSYGFKRPVAA